MQEIDYQPRLSWWGHTWRYLLTVVIAALAWFELAQWQWQHARWWFWSDLAVGLVTLVLCAFRRRFPVTVATVTAVASGFSASAGGPATLALVSLATRRRWREIIPLAVLSLVFSAVLERLNPVSDVDWAFIGPAIASVIGVSIGWGMYIGSRRELMGTLQLRAETAETEQSARVAAARTSERARIAREMHDVLAHRISLVSMHAGALAYRTDLDAEQVRASAEIIQDSSHQALVELREVLGVLREGPGDAAPERPQPSAEDLPDLVDEARRSGMRVDTAYDVAIDDMPVALGRTVYRIVQEGLTNARKHAPDTRVLVTLDGGHADGLTVEVRNPFRVGSPDQPVPESGLGLLGLAERAALAGGRMTHRVTAEREFVLNAWIPWPA